MPKPIWGDTLVNDINHLHILVACLKDFVGKDDDLDAQVSDLQWQIGMFWRKYRKLYGGESQ
ncbi:MAG: hypothetical protein LAO03_10240 [Acidobacteriia bacterium]|nr:hypothetical protein [Terriglobia bacterium]